MTDVGGGRVTAHEERLTKEVARAELALTRARQRLEDVLLELEPLEARHLEDGSGYVPPPLRSARKALEVATRSVARYEEALAITRGRLASDTLPGLE